MLLLVCIVYITRSEGNIQHLEDLSVVPRCIIKLDPLSFPKFSFLPYTDPHVAVDETGTGCCPAVPDRSPL